MVPSTLSLDGDVHLLRNETPVTGMVPAQQQNACTMEKSIYTGETREDFREERTTEMNEIGQEIIAKAQTRDATQQPPTLDYAQATRE